MIRSIVFAVVFSWIVGLGIVGALRHDQTDVRAAEPFQFLPTIQHTVPILDGDGEPLLQETAEAIGTEIARLRTLHGFDSVTVSSVLSRHADYIAAGILSTPDINEDMAQTHTKTVVADMPYVAAAAAVYCEDYVCTDPAAGARHFGKMILNHAAKTDALLQANLKEVGISVMQAEIDGKIVTCMVVCSATATVTQAQSKVPEPLFTEDTLAPQVKTTPIYVPRGGALTTAMVENALQITDERGEQPVCSYDVTTIDTAQEGTQTLSAVVADKKGNQTSCTVIVQVAVPTLPVILSETIILPEISGQEIWDVAKYVQVTDQCGVQSVQTEPMYLTPDILPTTKTVRVTVTNLFGLTAQAEVPVEQGKITYKKIAADAQGAQLTVEAASGSDVRQNGHARLVCSSAENGVYYFTVTDSDGVQRTFIRDRNELVWNPKVAGATTLAVTVLDGATGIVRSRSTVNIIVAEKQIFVYNTLVLSFAADSGFVLDLAQAQIRGVQPETLVETLQAAAKVTGGDGEITFSFTSAKGAVMAVGDVVTSGTEMTVLEDGHVRATYTVLIYGDINGDGKIGIADFAKLRQELLKGNLITGIYTQAADVNYDGKIGIADFAKLRQYLLGKIDISQS